MGKLSGKVAVVTGIAIGGTGFGIASSYLREGAAVLVTDIDAHRVAESLAALEMLGDVAGFVGNVSNRADANRAIASAADRFGGLDILVNNAATSTPGVMLEDLDDDAIQLTIGSSLYGTIHHMQAAFPFLKRRGGSVINFGSRNGIVGAAGFSVYAAAKEGVRGLSRAAAREWGAHKIRVNVICPATLSPGAKAYLDNNPIEAERSMAGIALGYLGDAVKDIAPLAVFLASDDSRYITGQTINVDGGQAML